MLILTAKMRSEIFFLMLILSALGTAFGNFRLYPTQIVNYQVVEALKASLKRLANCTTEPPCRIVKDCTTNASSIVCNEKQNETTLLIDKVKAFPPWILRKPQDRFYDKEDSADIVHCHGSGSAVNYDFEVPTAYTFEQLANWIVETRQPLYHGYDGSRRQIVVSFYKTNFRVETLDDKILCKFLYVLKKTKLKIWFRQTNIMKVAGHTFDRYDCSMRLNFISAILDPLRIDEFEISGSHELTIERHAFHGVQIAKLRLWHNDYVIIDEKAFDGALIEYLDLSHNSMKEIDSRMFNGILPQLQSLHLEYNNMTSFEPTGVLHANEIADIRFAWLAIFQHFARKFPDSYWDRIRIAPNSFNCTDASFLLRWIGCSFPDKGHYLFIRCTDPIEWRGHSLGEVPFIRNSVYCERPEVLAAKQRSNSVVVETNSKPNRRPLDKVRPNAVLEDPV